MFQLRFHSLQITHRLEVLISREFSRKGRTQVKTNLMKGTRSHLLVVFLVTDQFNGYAE